MRRLFWIGVGVGVTVVVIRKGQQLRARYSPPALVDRAARDLGERADALSSRIVAAGRGFGTDLRAAMAVREAQLRASVLSEGQPDPDVVREQRETARHSGAGEYPGRVSRLDEDGDLPYSF